MTDKRKAANRPPLTNAYPTPLTAAIPILGPGLVSSIKAFGPSPEALAGDPVQAKVNAAVAAVGVELVNRDRARNEARRVADFDRELKRIEDELARHEARRPRLSRR